ncbi:DUF2600 family protein, partial [Bacillus pumilus]|uniref:DUF2600 family protein n=1 Tax=Bacillus pumilus TaxID=1408 RepID=UPI00119DE093
DFQVHKHVLPHQRLPPLQSSFPQYQKHFPNIQSYQFSPSPASTLPIFSLLPYTLQPHFTQMHTKQIYETYFPY